MAADVGVGDGDAGVALTGAMFAGTFASTAR